MECNQILISCLIFVLCAILEYLYFQVEKEIDLKNYELEINILTRYRETDQVLLNLNMTTSVWTSCLIYPQMLIKVHLLCFKWKGLIMWTSNTWFSGWGDNCPGGRKGFPWRNEHNNDLPITHTQMWSASIKIRPYTGTFQSWNLVMKPFPHWPLTQINPSVYADANV